MVALPFVVGGGGRDVDVVAGRDLVGDAALGVDVHRDRDEVLLRDRLRERAADAILRGDERLRGDELLRVDAARRDLVRRARSRSVTIDGGTELSATFSFFTRPAWSASCPVVPFAMSLVATSASTKRAFSCARCRRRSTRTRTPRSPRQRRGRWPRRPSAFDDSTPRLPSRRSVLSPGIVGPRRVAA